jgi:hypothetical protein
VKVERISAHIRFSKDTRQGWKTIELGAEASIDPATEDWVICQTGLYSQLAQRLRTLWSQNGHNPEHSQNGQEKPKEASWRELESYPSPVEKKPAPKAHWCEEHQTAFRKFERDGRFWYSHKNGDGWCKEQRAMKGVA